MAEIWENNMADLNIFFFSHMKYGGKITNTVPLTKSNKYIFTRFCSFLKNTPETVQVGAISKTQK